jgi:hypothetical protein
VIRHPALGEVVGADALGAIARTDLRPAVGGPRRVDLGPLRVEEPRAQHRHGDLAVAVLRLL